MRNHYQSNLMWSIIVVALLWLAPSAGAVPLESWDDKIPTATQRFKILTEFGGAAVLDQGNPARVGEVARSHALKLGPSE